MEPTIRTYDLGDQCITLTSTQCQGFAVLREETIGYRVARDEWRLDATEPALLALTEPIQRYWIRRTWRTEEDMERDLKTLHTALHGAQERRATRMRSKYVPNTLSR